MGQTTASLFGKPWPRVMHDAGLAMLASISLTAGQPASMATVIEFAGYYAYWERCIFAAVNTMVLSAVDATQARLRACSAAKDGESPVKPPTLVVG